MKSVRLVLKPIGNPSLPIAHFDILQGIFYHLLSMDSDLADEIHNRQQGVHRPFKFFCFTDIKGKKEFSANRIFYQGVCTWEIRSADERIIDAIKKGIAFLKTITLDDGVFKIVSYSVFETKFIDSEIVLRLDTPATVYTTNDDGFVTYYAPTDEKFISGLVSNIYKKCHAFYGKELCADIRISVTSNNNEKCITRYRDYVITSYYGRFRVTAPPEVLELIYHTGFGSKNSMGFGTVSV